MFFIAVISPFLVWQSFSIVNDFNGDREKSDFNLVREAIIAAGAHESYINRTRQLLESTVTSPIIQSRDKASCEEYLKLFAQITENRIYTGTAVINAKGDIWCSTLPLPETQVNVSDRAYFKKVMETKTFTIGEYQIGRLSGIPGIPLVYPMLDRNGEVTGMVAAQINAHELVNYFSADKLKDGFVFLLLDRNGALLARLPTNKEFIGKQLSDQHEFLKTLREQEAFGLSDGVFKGMDFDGIQRVFGFTKISPKNAVSDLDLYILVGMEQRLAYAAAYSGLFNRFGVLFGLTFLGIFFAAIAQRLFLKN